jgi:hypothetical protein
MADEDKDLEAKLEKLINERVNVAISGGFRRLETNLDSKLDKAFEKLITKQDAPTTPATEDTVEADTPKTVKGVMEQLSALKKSVDNERKLRLEAESREKDSKARSKVHSELSKHFGSDNPSVGLLVDSLYDVKKRFKLDESGDLQVNFKRDFGDEVLPFEQGIKELMENELRQYLPSKVKTVTNPSSYVRQAQQTSTSHTQDQAGARAKMMQSIADDIKASNPELARKLQGQ